MCLLRDLHGVIKEETIKQIRKERPDLIPALEDEDQPDIQIGEFWPPDKFEVV